MMNNKRSLSILSTTTAIIIEIVALCLALSQCLSWEMESIAESVLHSSRLLLAVAVFALLAVNAQEKRLSIIFTLMLISILTEQCIRFYPDANATNFIMYSITGVGIIAHISGFVMLALTSYMSRSVKIASWIIALLPLAGSSVETIGQSIFVAESIWNGYSFIKMILKYGSEIWFFIALASWLKETESANTQIL